jgi:putative endonuclease
VCSLRHIIAKAAAALLLWLKGHRIVARKYNTPVGPIDFVTVQDNRLAFIETKRHQVGVIPSRHKRRTIRAAQYWLAAHPNFYGYEIAFDAVFGGALPRYVADVITIHHSAPANGSGCAEESGSLQPASRRSAKVAS